MIDAQEVEKIFLDCLWTDEEIATFKIASEQTDVTEYVKERSIFLEGVSIQVGFNPEKITTHETRIGEILKELSPNFLKGASFLQLPFDKNENQWGEHRNAEQLLLLGMAIGKMKFGLSDRVVWEAMPGGLPYIVLNHNGR